MNEGKLNAELNDHLRALQGEWMETTLENKV